MGMNMESMLRAVASGLLLLALGVVGSASAETAGAAEEATVTGSKISEHPDWFKESFLDIAEDVADGAESGKHVMLFMHLNGCPYCYKTVEENIKNSPYTDFIKENFAVIAINIQGDREVAFNEETTMKEKDLAKMLKVRFTPTVIFLNSANQVVLRLNGYRTRSAFNHALEFVKQKGYEQMTLAQFIEQQSPEQPYLLRSHPQLQALTNLQAVADKPLALLFEDQWCLDACNTLHDGNLSQPETQAILANFTFVRLDAGSTTPIVDVDGNQTTPKAYAEKLGLSYRPGIVMFDRGREIRRIDGMLFSFHFQENLRYVGERGYERYANDYQKFMADRTKAVLASGRNIDISK
jgi:thioredoxin-related protein